MSNGQLVKTSDKMRTVKQFLESAKPAIAGALVRHITPERLMRVTMTAIQRNPDLLDCDRMSLLGSVMTCAQLGLEPGPLGHAYLIPFNDKNSGKRLVQFIPGYRGLIDLARRSGAVDSIAAYAVYEHDEFDYALGDSPFVGHKPALGERGKMVAVYAVARLKDCAVPQVDVMSKADVDAIRRRSKAADNGPWVTDYDEMARKTVVRRLFKYLPVSVELSRAISHDEPGVAPDYSDVIDADAVTEEQAAPKDKLDELADKIGGEAA